MTPLPPFAAVSAALAAGLPPAAAVIAAAGDAGPLARPAALLRAGRPLRRVATGTTGDPACDLLLRGLAVADHAGAGGLAAAGRAASAAAAHAAVVRLVGVRTAQARGTAAALTWIPAIVALLLALLDPGAAVFWGSRPGLLAGTVGLGLLAGARVWSRRLVRAALDARRPPDQPRRRRAVHALLAIAAAAGLATLSPVLVVPGALGVVVAVRRAGAPSPPPSLPPDVVAEVAELLAIAVDAGVPTTDAVALLAHIGPPPARPVLRAAAARLAAGTPPGDALGDDLRAVGAVLDITDRWGGPTAPALTHVAAEERAGWRAAVEQAVERLPVLLTFPTTLLLVPGFAVLVVAPQVAAVIATFADLSPIP